MRTPFRKRVQPVSPSSAPRAVAAVGTSAAVLFGLIALAAADAGAQVRSESRPESRQPAADRRAVPAHQAATERLAAVKSWAYQLQHADPAEIARSSYDLVVVDYSVNGDPAKPLKAADVERMKKKPGGGRRIVLAYVSIGEAEDYRFYWNEDWIETALPAAGSRPSAGRAGGSPAPEPPPGQGGTEAAAPANSRPDRWVSAKAPPWLGDESETWGGNFAVKYWDPEWQALIHGTPQSFVERVLALGFDGVYLDRVDAYYEHVDEHPTAAEDMVDFVVGLAASARTARPGALVVVQNGEELLTRPAYVAAIDAIAKEDLLYGSPTEGVQNSEAQIANSLGWLSHARVAGRPVLVIEYLDQEDAIRAAQQDLLQRGFIPYFGPRSLDRLAKPPAATAATVRPADGGRR